MNELIAVAVFTVLAVISPGADFAMVTRSSYAQGRKAGLAAAVGIALGVQVHVLYTVLGIAVIISQSPALFMAMKVLGAGYLIYLGYQSLTNTKRIHLDDVGQRQSWGSLRALRTGFFTNALNPKTMLFVISAYTQVVQPAARWRRTLPTARSCPSPIGCGSAWWRCFFPAQRCAWQ